MPMARGEGDRSGRGRMGPAVNRPHRERGQSPPAEGESSGQTNSEREKAVDVRSGRGIREHSAGGTTGGAGGVAGPGGGVAGRFGRHIADGGKIPRLKQTRYRDGERGPAINDKAQLPPVS